MAAVAVWTNARSEHKGCTVSTLKAAPVGIGLLSSLKTAHCWSQELYQTPSGWGFQVDLPASPKALYVTNTMALGSLLVMLSSKRNPSPSRLPGAEKSGVLRVQHTLQ